MKVRSSAGCGESPWKQFLCDIVASRRLVRSGKRTDCLSLSRRQANEGLPHYCSAVVASHWPRSLLILWTSNVGSPKESLAFLPTSSTRSPGFRDCCCLLVRL